MLFRSNVDPRQPVDLQVHEQPFFDVQLVEGCGRPSQGHFYPGGPEVAVQVDDEIKMFLLQIPDDIGKASLQQVEPVDMRIRPDHGIEFLLGEEMDLRTGQLFAEAPDHGSGKHDIADGTEP